MTTNLKPSLRQDIADTVVLAYGGRRLRYLTDPALGFLLTDRVSAPMPKPDEANPVEPLAWINLPGDGHDHPGRAANLILTWLEASGYYSMEPMSVDGRPALCFTPAVAP